MNISPIMSPPIGSTAPLIFPSRIQAANDPSSIVALSAAAQALYATSSANSQTGNFSLAASEAQTFADAFSGLLQYGYDLSGYYPSGLSPGSMLTQAINAQQTNSGQTLMASLQSIGIQYQEPGANDPAGSVTVDFNKLQSAYNSDQAGTLSLLSEANQAIGQIAGENAGNMALLPAQQGTNASAGSTALVQSVVGNQDAVQTLTSIALNATGQANSLLPGIANLSPSEELATLAASEQLSVAEQFAAVTQSSSTNTALATAAAASVAIAAAAAPSAGQAATAETTVATAMAAGTSPATPQNLQAATAAVSAGAAAMPAAAAQAPSNTIDPFLVATSPFTAQAVAAYHMVDGIFDTGKGRPYSHSGDPYGEYMPVEPSVPVREQLHR